MIFAEGGEPDLTIIDLEGNDSMVLEMILTDDVTDHQVQIIVSHLQVMQAQVMLDMTVFSSGQTKDIHVGEGDRVRCPLHCVGRRHGERNWIKGI